MANHHKKTKSKGLVLNTKTESINMDTKIDLEVFEIFVKCYKKHFFKKFG